jgi:hypothetical protein
MEERARRIGENEALFRSVNDEVRALDERFGARPDANVMSIVCECGQADCIEHLELRPDEYEAVRAEGACFAIKPGHEEPEAEDVVARHDGYWVVKKHEGEPAKLARQTDPRR